MQIDRLRRIFCIYPTPTIVFLLGFGVRGLCSGEFYWISHLTAGEIRQSPGQNAIPDVLRLSDVVRLCILVADILLGGMVTVCTVL